MNNLHLMCKLITSIDLKGQCGPLDLLGFSWDILGIERGKGKSHCSLFILGVEEEEEESKGEGKGEEQGEEGLYLAIEEDH